jgi:hypothetical protein
VMLAGWSACHGFTTRALTANLSEHLHADTATLAAQIVRGIITLGELAQRASDRSNERNELLQSPSGGEVVKHGAYCTPRKGCQAAEECS